MKVLTLSIMVANELKNMIEQDNLKEGDKLPSERDLCEKLNVQRLTLRSGLRILMQEGMIVSKERSGYFVNKPRIEKNVFRLESTTASTFQQGLNMNVEILRLEKREINKSLSGKMKLPLGTKVYELERLRSVDGEPVSLDTSYIPVSIAPKLSFEAIEAKTLYEVLESEHGSGVDHSQQEILVCEADERQSELLKVEIGELMVLQQGLAFDQHDQQMEYTECIMKMDRFVYVN